ncbi:Adenylyl cyclase-associated protein [Diplonema papillatum]|nr:Adenylyl cyclase-associated protein [Diplonema papillatum]
MLKMEEPLQQYLVAKNIPDLMNEMAEVLMDARPENIYEHLAEWLESSSDADTLTGAAGPKKAGIPPPPPPPPPPAFFDNLLGKSKATDDAAKAAAQRAALFADIAKGVDISKGLRKVSDSEKRHKNRDKEEVGKATDFAELERRKALRQEELERKQRPQSQQAPKPAKLVLEGKQWKIENQAGTRSVKKHDVLADANMTHCLYVSECENYFLEVPEKVNMIILSECKNVDLMLHKDVVSGVEMSKAVKIQVQACGNLPSFIVDRCDEVTLYASDQSRNVEITSCASTCVNVTFPDAEGGEDPIEKPVPEQFVTTIEITDSGPKLVTKPMEHAA